MRELIFQRGPHKASVAHLYKAGDRTCVSVNEHILRLLNATECRDLGKWFIEAADEIEKR